MDRPSTFWPFDISSKMTITEDSFGPIPSQPGDRQLSRLMPNEATTDWQRVFVQAARPVSLPRSERRMLWGRGQLTTARTRTVLALLAAAAADRLLQAAELI